MMRRMYSIRSVFFVKESWCCNVESTKKKKWEGRLLPSFSFGFCYASVCKFNLFIFFISLILIILWPLKRCNNTKETRVKIFSMLFKWYVSLNVAQQLFDNVSKPIPWELCAVICRLRILKSSKFYPDLTNLILHAKSLTKIDKKIWRAVTPNKYEFFMHFVYVYIFFYCVLK